MKNKIKETVEMIEMKMITSISDNVSCKSIYKDEIEKLIKKLDVKNLQHYKDTTVGLYAIDFDPKELIERFINSQSDACSLLCEDAERLIEDWHKFIDDKNYFKSPFFQLKS